MELSQEQLDSLSELIRQSKATSAEQAPQAQPLTIKLGGRDYQAKDQAELQSLIDGYSAQQSQDLDAKLEEIRQAQAAMSTQMQQRRQASQQHPDNGRMTPEQKEEYAKLFIDNPFEANRYVIQNDPLIRNLFVTQANDISALKQEVAAAQFLLQNKDYEQKPENYKAIESIITQYNLPWDINGMNAAYGLAKQTGMIGERSEQAQPQAQQMQEEEVAPPPRVSRRRSNQPSELDLVEEFSNWPVEKMRAWLENQPTGPR